MSKFSASPQKLAVLTHKVVNLDAGVYDLLAESGFPGMDVYQFEAKKMDDAKPDEARERLYYASTHDSQTLLGWCRTAFPEENAEAKAAEILKKLYHSEAKWVLAQLQDLLGLDDAARFNTPGTVGPHNWSWRADSALLTDELAARAAAMVKNAGR